MGFNQRCRTIHESNGQRDYEMVELRTEENWSLQMIANKFGLSRERVRQIIGNSGSRYGGFHHGSLDPSDRELIINSPDKTNDQLAIETGASQSVISSLRGKTRHAIKESDTPLSIGFRSEELVSSLLSEMGIDNELMPCHHPFDILANGNVRVDVKTSGKVHNDRMVSPQYAFHVRGSKKRQDTDFYICLTSDTMDAFIIPASAIPESLLQVTFCWPRALRKHRDCIDWRPYHNRWDLIQNFSKEA